ncbi:hypothetical protein H2201_002700 [Coniosporium apollinis]|uniref:CNH domain-containing protein n=1 Tax=Coniosporium apollinis TaxID=61459 RepID=A0ABQ9P0S4_9PEZI|nr:hypothetical protein H2201_002700 [Coniosporium apollinis]
MSAATGPQSPPELHSRSTHGGPYVLRQLIRDVPLSADEPAENVQITYIEVWNENLYVGTSAAEILHFVLLPAEPQDPLGAPTCILASRLQPASSQSSSVGVQKILLLPQVNKACVLCNNTLSFYSLPELSPAFPNVKPLTCGWVGGVDANIEHAEDVGEDGVVIMLGLAKRIRLVRIREHEEPRGVRAIEFGGCQDAVRRQDVACVADGQSYALVDVVQQQKIPLFSISSVEEQATIAPSSEPEDAPSSESQRASRSGSTASTQIKPARDDHSHGRSTSLGIFAHGAGDQQRQESPRRPGANRFGFDAPDILRRMQSPATAASPERRPSRGASPAPRPSTPDKPLPPEPAKQQTARSFVALKPHVASPTPTEFLLTTGTSPSEPGVGMFVNLEGDPARGTIEFSSYPEAIVIDGRGIDMSIPPGPGSENSEEGFVLAVLSHSSGNRKQYSVEVQRWDIDPDEGAASKERLDLSLMLGDADEQKPMQETSHSLGIRRVIAEQGVILPLISSKLTLKRLNLSSKDSSVERLSSASDATKPASNQAEIDSAAITAREKEEREFTGRLCKLKSSVVLWAGEQIYWLVRNPLIIKLDAKLDLAITSTTGADAQSFEINRPQVESLLNEIRGHEPRTALDYLGLRYIRQKASILLLMNLILRTSSGIIVFEHEKAVAEEALVQSEIDPRIVLTLLPVLSDEVVQGKLGVWVQNGLNTVLEAFLSRQSALLVSANPVGPFGDNIMHLVKRFLYVWRRKKGMASIPDEKEVFYTVDAAIIHLLLLLDSQSPKGPANVGSIRSELNGVVDNGVECFERAVALLEQFHRLYVLSRLYQSKKMSAMVLATWRRIIEGERDDGGELTDGEQEVRKYLIRIRDPALVEEYGTWLADRNPKLGVQVFADDNSRVKFQPAHAVAILKKKAPAAVKEYLEHLVFGKKQTQYANELIAFYLDMVVSELGSSEDSRSILLQTYETYRALRPPKPTYRQFITDNAMDTEWWHSRLRLLQLLGSSQDLASSYDVSAILTRLEPHEQELVPEMIILNGRQGKHEDAIRLLTHGLGDYDTAISYCLLGGSSIFRPISGFMPRDTVPPREEQAKLFGYLLHEFLRIEDMSDRIERTGELLERFGGWFDVADVLAMLPDTWSIDIFSGFLVNALRRLVRERHETTIARALNSAHNLKTSADLVEQVDEIGPVVERVK